MCSMLTRLLARSLTHSHSHTHTHSLHSTPLRSITHSLTHLAHSFTHSPLHSLTHSHVHSHLTLTLTVTVTTIPTFITTITSLDANASKSLDFLLGSGVYTTRSSDMVWNQSLCCVWSLGNPERPHVHSGTAAQRSIIVPARCLVHA